MPYATARDGTRIYYGLAGESVAALWAALRDVASEHLAGMDRLASAYLGDRAGLELVGLAIATRRLRSLKPASSAD